MSFPWENVTAAYSHGHPPKTQGRLNGDEVSQWVVTILDVGQGLSLANPEERLGAW